MKAVRAASVKEARDFFADELKSVAERQHLCAKPSSIDYLTDLLMTYMKSDVFFARSTDGRLENNVLAELYFGYLQGDAQTKKLFLKRLGDICLLVTGIFPDSLRRKIVDIDYYFGMGGSAYRRLASFQLNQVAQKLFEELSQKFIAFSNVLSEMAERSGLQSNLDLLRVYEKWLLTGNDRLKALLQEHGISTPIKVDRNTKQ